MLLLIEELKSQDNLITIWIPITITEPEILKLYTIHYTANIRAYKEASCLFLIVSQTTFLVVSLITFNLTIFSNTPIM